MIRDATENDFNDIYNIINDAAIAYKGIIPEDRWHEPYMTREELQAQIEDGVKFSCCPPASYRPGQMRHKKAQKAPKIQLAFS
jgi:hypothetical protein